MRWPAEWRDPAMLDLLKGTPLGCLLLPSTEGYQNVIERAQQLDITTCDINRPPAGVEPRTELVKGEWPGIRMTPGQGDASAGPTGAPWIDSNGWLVRLTRAREPGATVWVAADPPPHNEIVPLSRHLVAVADGAAHGGCWVVTLDKDLADGLAARKPGSLDSWKKLMAAVAFFQAHTEWSAWPVDAVLSVVSSFSGDNEFFSHELLNLMARTNISYGMVETAALRPEALRGLRAALYPDAQPPPAEVRQALLGFAERGGLLIAGPKSGMMTGDPEAGAGQTGGLSLGELRSPAGPGGPARTGGSAPQKWPDSSGQAGGLSHPRYEMRRFGKGRIAMAYKQPEDPYEMAQDAQILLSHRYDLLRFFNGFLLGGYSTVSPDGKRRLAHIVNYGGGADDDDPATARIAGRFRAAKLWSCDHAEARRLDMAPQKEAVEVPLPGLAVYGGVELETNA